MRVHLPYPAQLFCDNQAALHIAKNQCFMKEPNIQRLIVTLFENDWYLENLFSLQFIQQSCSRYLYKGSRQTTISFLEIQVGHYQSSCTNLRGSDGRILYIINSLQFNYGIQFYIQLYPFHSQRIKLGVFNYFSYTQHLCIKASEHVSMKRQSNWSPLAAYYTHSNSSCITIVQIFSA